MNVVFSQAAEHDLEAIGDFIAGDDSSRALAFVRALREVALALGDTPDAYPLVPRYEHYGIRRRVWANYLIFYRARSGRVSILRVLHGARDYEPLLFS